MGMVVFIDYHVIKIINHIVIVLNVIMIYSAYEGVLIDNKAFICSFVYIIVPIEVCVVLGSV